MVLWRTKITILVLEWLAVVKVLITPQQKTKVFEYLRRVSARVCCLSWDNKTEGFQLTPATDLVQLNQTQLTLVLLHLTMIMKMTTIYV